MKILIFCSLLLAVQCSDFSKEKTKAPAIVPPVVPENNMAKAAADFLGSLRPEQRAKAVVDFSAEERFNWHYFPKDRKGIPLEDLTQDQRDKLTGLLKSGLSLPLGFLCRHRFFLSGFEGLLRCGNR